MHDQELALFRGMLRGTKALLHRVWPAVGEDSLTGAQFGLLMHLRCRGTMAPSELGEVMFVSPANVTGMVERLHRQGLLERRRDRTDRRRLSLALTAAGRARLEQLEPRFNESVARAFSGLSAADRRDLGRILERLHATLAPPPPAPSRRSPR